MALDPSKLENVQESGRKTIARCPACAEAGADEKGNHLVIREDGRFGCVLHPGAGGKAHRSRIFALVGIQTVPRRPKYTVAVRKAACQAPAGAGAFGPVSFPKQVPSDFREMVRARSPEERMAYEKSLPEFLFQAPVRSMEYGDPNFGDTPDGSLVLALLYREGKVVCRLLYADPAQHCFWDCGTKEHVGPPRFYLLVSESPGFDPMSGFPVVGGAICPF